MTPAGATNEYTERCRLASRVTGMTNTHTHILVCTYELQLSSQLTGRHTCVCTQTFCTHFPSPEASLKKSPSTFTCSQKQNKHPCCDPSTLCSTVQGYEIQVFTSLLLDTREKKTKSAREPPQPAHRHPHSQRPYSSTHPPSHPPKTKTFDLVGLCSGATPLHTHLCISIGVCITGRHTIPSP